MFNLTEYCCLGWWSRYPLKCFRLGCGSSCRSQQDILWFNTKFSSCSWNLKSSLLLGNICSQTHARILIFSSPYVAEEVLLSVSFYPTPLRLCRKWLSPCEYCGILWLFRYLILRSVSSLRSRQLQIIKSSSWVSWLTTLSNTCKKDGVATTT